MPISFTVKTNRRQAGQELAISNEAHTVSLVSPFVVKLIEVPLLEAVSSVFVPGYIETSSTSPSTGRFFINYSTGYLTFNATAAGAAVLVSYKGQGSIVDATDIDDIQTTLVSVANEVVDARGSLLSLDSRLDVSLNTDGTLASGVVHPSSISGLIGDDFVFPHDVTVTGTLSVGAVAASTLSFPVLAVDPISPSVGQVWYNSVSQQFVGQSGSGIVVLG